MKKTSKSIVKQAHGHGGFDGFDRTPLPFDAANRLTTSIQSPCVAITAWVDAISLPGTAFWLEFKKKLVHCMDHITKNGGKEQAYTNPLSLNSDSNTS